MPPMRLRVLAAAWRRFRWARRDELRVALWGGRTGYLPQPRPAGTLARVAEPLGCAPRPAAPGSATIGLLDDRAGRLAAECARFLGLPAGRPGPAGPTELAERATREGWPLLAADWGSAGEMPHDATAALTSYVSRGGTLLLLNGAAGTTALPERLIRSLGLEPPATVSGPAMGAVRFPADRVEFAAELAGTQLATRAGDRWLVAAGHPRTRSLVEGMADGTARPVVIERGAGAGRVVLAAAPTGLAASLREGLAGGESAAWLVVLMALRQVAGETAWHPPAALAAHSIDDPALRGGRLGLPYEALAARAREGGFHVAIATIPRELPLAHSGVVQALASDRDHLSACYHGWQHDGYEFYLSRSRRMRHGGRPLARQRTAVQRAAAAGRWFAERHDLALDRVMVFPHGIGPAAILAELRAAGFLASCNLGDRYPLGAPVPDDPDLGLRPADVAWSGYPLLWRRSLEDAAWPIDLFLGRPVLSLAHRSEVLPDFRPLAERAQAVVAALRGAGRRPAWCGLEEVARHAYVQRRDPVRGWEAQIGAEEACLHNPESAPRTYLVHRPYESESAVGGPDPGGERETGPAVVTVPPGSAVWLRPAAPAATAQTWCCPLFPPTADLDRGVTSRTRGGHT